MKRSAESLLDAGSARRQIHVLADVLHRIAQHASGGALHSHPAMLIHGELIVAGPTARFEHEVGLLRIERHGNVGALLNNVLHQIGV